MKLGFIGTGTISKAVITGLLRNLPEETADILDVVVSPRNAETARELAETFPAVAIATSNQEVIDLCDHVCLAVTPQIAHDVLSALTFRPDHTLISFIATVDHATLQTLCAPANAIHLTIPMPPIAEGLGPLPLFPPSNELAILFQRTAEVIQLDNEADLQALSAMTGMMAPFYDLFDTAQTWLTEKGLPQEAASTYTASLFHALAHDAKGQDPARGFSPLAKSCQTEGGINAQSYQMLQAENWLAPYRTALDSLHKRIQNG